MTDDTTDTLSTVIDTEPGASASGAGMPTKLPEDDKSLSLRDTVASVVKESAEEPEKAEKAAEPEEKPAEAEEKPVTKPEASKPQRDPSGKFAPAEKPEAEPKEQERPEGKKYPEPPARFLPDSKEVWRNVPRPVQRDIEVMARSHAEEMERSRTAVERYESVRQFDEIARQNGRELKDSLAKVVEIEDALARNPIAGLDRILQEVGPRKANGQPLTLFEVAQHIVSQGPQAYQQQSAQAQQQHSQTQVQQLQQRLAQIEQERQGEALAHQVIQPFAQAHPRYYELQDDIALFLQSGRIPASLSPAERLEAAYVMAERLNPPSDGPTSATSDPDPESRAANSLNGTKSIKSAPGAVSEDLEPDSGGSIRDVLEDVVKKQLRRA